MPDISLIICTHNPRPNYLRRVLDALKTQTLAREQWELLLLDNASGERLADAWDLSWHPQSRHVREDEVGLTSARLRGIRESSGELLVFVDDDNVLANDFLSCALDIAQGNPFLGAWGGNVEAEFEEPPPQWLKSHYNILALRIVDHDYWANYYSDNRSMPFGAGLCIRRSVAVKYVKLIEARPESRNLDRKGPSLMSGGDVDLALSAHDLGLGTGMFQKLRVTHLIPKARMAPDYICRLLEAVEYSTHLLKSQRDPGYILSGESLAIKYLKAYQIWRLPEPLRSFARAKQRGFETARNFISGRCR